MQINSPLFEGPPQPFDEDVDPLPGRVMRSMIPKGEDRFFCEDPINLVHQFQRLSIHTDRRGIKRRPANLQQLALLGQAQVCAASVDQRLAFSLSGSCCA
tara:strand:- start:352 stop:651 length:300 start_codon:yes stop_codon:yes gene_type:complete